jgi:uncharacterized SAM-binding protein YcdF (DUF218 family)
MHAVYPNLKRRRIIPFLLVAVTISVLLAVGLILGVGYWLTVEDPLDHAQAIVVLSGRMPIRAVEAAQLYRSGYAAQVWLTRPAEPAASLQALHIAYIGEDFYNLRILMQQGVPENAIRVLEPAIYNTADEIRVVMAELRRQSDSRVILVTTKAHTRRVRALSAKFSSPGTHVIVRAARNDAFQPARWWRTSGDALDVVREVLGILNVWAGLPLQPTE